MNGTKVDVHIGAYLPSKGRLGTGSILAELAQMAESVAYDSIWLGDHIVIPHHVRSPYPYADVKPPTANEIYNECLTTLAFLAGKTNQIFLGTGVLVLPLRNPILAAKMLATIDHLSEGRLLVGVGAGWLREEFAILQEGEFVNRGNTTSEYMRTYRALWASASQDGIKEPPLEGVTISPKPVQPYGPPLWVGGNSHAAISRAAVLGDGWFPFGITGDGMLRPTELSKMIRTLDIERRSVGRPEGAVRVVLGCHIQFGERAGLLTGAPADIAQDMLNYQRVGVNGFVAAFPQRRFPLYAESMATFAQEVVPLLSEAGD